MGLLYLIVFNPEEREYLMTRLNNPNIFSAYNLCMNIFAGYNQIGWYGRGMCILNYHLFI